MSDNHPPKVPDEWAEALAELAKCCAAASAMGGADKLARRRRQGRLNAREVITAFADEGSFHELGRLVGCLDGIPADALVGGIATVDGRPLVIAAEDFTVKGGSIGPGTAAKRERLARLAAQERIPYVLFLDGAGYRVSNSLERHPYTPNDLQVLASIQGKVPTVAVVLGVAAGHSALSGAMMDCLVMLKDACLFSAGPPLVAAASGEHSSPEQLGGAALHANHSSLCHQVVDDEIAACRFVRRYLGLMPSHRDCGTIRASGPATGARRLDNLLQLIPRNAQLPYDMQGVIDELADEGSALALQADYGASLITCLARLGGHAVGIVANQPQVTAGAITPEAAAKAARFLDRCGAFNLPVIFLADNPGILPGRQAEQQGALRYAADMYAAQARLRSPKLHVTLRKAYGFGSSVMAMNPFDQQTLTLAFPGATLAGIPADGGAKAADIDPNIRAQLRQAEADAAWASSDNLAYDEIIDPRDLRNVLITGLELAVARTAGHPGASAAPTPHCDPLRTSASAPAAPTKNPRTSIT